MAAITRREVGQLVGQLVEHMIRQRADIERRPPAPKVPQTGSDAASTLFAPLVVQSNAFKERELRAERGNSDPDLVDFATHFTRALKDRGFPFFPIEWERGRERQDALKAQGLSRASWGQSAHNFGMAVDVVHFGRFWQLSRAEWAVVGLIGKEVARKRNIKIRWGGDWDFYDPAHWELSDWKVRAASRIVDVMRNR